MSDERRRGLRRVALAVLLLFVAFVLLLVWQPARGGYVEWQRWSIGGLAALGWLLLLGGVYGTIVGAAGGFLKVVGVLAVVGGLAVGAVGAWLGHVVLTAEYSGEHGGGFDWD